MSTTPERTIPLGAVYYADVTQPTEFEITQFQDGSLFNRYLPKSPFATTGYDVPQVQRGQVSLIPVAKTSGSNNYRIYYPGDVVIDDSVSYPITGLGGSVYFSYIYKNTEPGEEFEFVGNANFFPSALILV